MFLSNYIFTVGLVSKFVATTLPWSTGPATIFQSVQTATPAHNVSARASVAGVSASTPKSLTSATQNVKLSTYDEGDLGLASSNHDSSWGDAWQSSNAKVMAGDDAGAENVLIKFHKLHPEYSPVTHFLAEELARREDWNGAANLLTQIGPNDGEEYYVYLKAAVFAHLGYVFAGEREVLTRYATKAIQSRFPTESPADIESLSWYLGADLLSGKSGMEARAIEYARRFEVMHPGDPQMAVIQGDCLNRMGRYAEAVAVLKPLANSDDSNVRGMVNGIYPIACRNLAAQQPRP